MIIDSRGRVFGRINIVDALVVLFVFALLPVAYATYLLFRPATPTITSVERVEISREERRVAGGNVILAKLKVKGSGFSPMLRASVGSVPALGFVFENPNSADVIVGEMPPGSFDVVLLDGVHEVARAANAFVVEATPVQFIRAAGYLTDLTQDRVDAFKVGDAYPPDNPQVRVIALGPAQNAHTRFQLGARVSDLTTRDRSERPAVMALRCDGRATDDICTIGGIPLTGDSPIVTLTSASGPIRFALTEVFPDTAPHLLNVVIRATGGPELRTVVVNDRDTLLDERAAVVMRVGSSSQAGSLEISVSLGVDPSREGWRYRGQLVQPGAPLALRFPGTLVRGVIQSAVDRTP